MYVRLEREEEDIELYILLVPKLIWGLLLNLDWLVQTSSKQTLRRDFVTHHWECINLSSIVLSLKNIWIYCSSRLNIAGNEYCTKSMNFKAC